MAPVWRATRAVREFLATEVAGGAFLAIGTVAAVVWANALGHRSYESAWATTVAMGTRTVGFHGDLRHFVNDGLMALFFLVVGLEIKRELVEGELRDRRTAVTPTLCAVGGMIVPALLFVAFNRTEPARHGWAIPMATDIAFALGVVALMPRRVPSSLRLFLLTLAIVDDVGSIVVIAVFYARPVDWAALLVAVGLVGLVIVLRARGVWSLALYGLVGLAVWLAVQRSGVNPTIAGVAVGLAAPAAATARLEHRLHPLTSFVIVPLFALANAGVTVDLHGLDPRGATAVAGAIVLARLAGKLAGITLFGWLALRLGLGALPQGLQPRHLFAVGAVAGVGFTVPLFVTDLAFAGTPLQAAAKLALLTATLIAAALGLVLLRATCRR